MCTYLTLRCTVATNVTAFAGVAYSQDKVNLSHLAMYSCIDGGWLVGSGSCVQYTVSVTRIHHAVHFPTQPRQSLGLQLMQKEMNE